MIFENSSVRVHGEIVVVAVGAFPLNGVLNELNPVKMGSLRFSVKTLKRNGAG